MRSWFAYRSADAGHPGGASSSQRPPPGIASTPLLGQTLSFHDAAHDDVRAILAGVAQDKDDETPLRTVRLNVIGRNVALVTSYATARLVLDQTWSHGSSKEEQPLPLSRFKAYDQLMSAFFSPPNLLLEDEGDAEAEQHRKHWDAILENAGKDNSISGRIDAFIASWTEALPLEEGIDLYDLCKTLGHQLALGTFLGLDAEQAGYSDAKEWSDEMLRGQFSLPVGINVGIFRNAFSKGQAAKKRYDAVVAKQMPTCPFATRLEQSADSLSKASMQSHLSMFSSSLVVKAFASLATALLLQLFRPLREGTLASRLRSEGAVKCLDLLDSILTETVRVSPPIIGVMRRVTRAEGLRLESDADAGITVPCGWDVWPYFPLANRDASVYDDPHSFRAERFMARAGTTPPPPPLSFGYGVKNCAGQDLVKSWLQKTAMAVLFGKGDETRVPLGIDVDFDADALDAGVLQWLGWDASTSQSWKGIKQLPTQRPRKAVQIVLRQQTSVH